MIPTRDFSEALETPRERLTFDTATQLLEALIDSKKIILHLCDFHKIELPTTTLKKINKAIDRAT